jgi:Na+/melibiose symporter-like transporter
MGVIADRTRTKWGRFRPWLVVVPLPIAVATAAMFYNPGLGSTETLIYAYVVYFTWSILYTLSDIPLWALSSVMTDDTEERTRLVSFGRVGSLIGILLPGVLVPVIAGGVAPDDQGRGYFIAAAIFAAVSVPLMMVAGVGTRERVEIPNERAQLRDVWEGFRINRPPHRCSRSCPSTGTRLRSRDTQRFFSACKRGALTRGFGRR